MKFNKEEDNLQAELLKANKVNYKYWIFRGSQQPGPHRAGKAQPVKVGEKVGRNDPCPCGSGKKYKQCHGK